MRKLESFQSFLETVGAGLEGRDELKRQTMGNAILDYLLAARNLDPSVDTQIFTLEGVEKAESMLKEDLSMEIPRDRGFALLSNVYLSEPIFKIDGRVRLRRATRFEIRTMAAEDGLWGQELPRYISKPERWDRVYPVHMVEVQSEEPFDVPLSDARFESAHDICLLAQDVVSCLRLLWGCPVGIRSTWVGSVSEYGVHSLSTTARPEMIVAENEPIMFLDGSSVDLYGIAPLLQIDRSMADRLREFCTIFHAFRIESPQTPFHKDYNRALIRYNQSFGERFIDDIVLDLGISIEALLRSPGSQASYRVAALVSSRTNIGKVCNFVTQFFDLRNKVAHGSTIERKDTPLIVKMSDVVRSCLRNSPFVAIGNSDLVQKKAFGSMLDRWVVSCEERKDSRSKIPQWSLEDLEIHSGVS